MNRLTIITVLLVLALGCETAEQKEAREAGMRRGEIPMSTNTTGEWEKISSPPGAPTGTRCWIYGGGAGSTAWGGPWCFVPQQQ